MTAQRLQSPVSFDQFMQWYPELAECGYELHRGVIVEMPKQGEALSGCRSNEWRVVS